MRSESMQNKTFIGGKKSSRLVPLNGFADTSVESVTDMVVHAMELLKIDLYKKVMEREDLARITKHLGISMSPFQIYEALFFARQSSAEPSQFRFDLLIQWLSRNLPVLRSTRQDLNRTDVNESSEMISLHRGGIGFS